MVENGGGKKGEVVPFRPKNAVKDITERMPLLRRNPGRKTAGSEKGPDEVKDLRSRRALLEGIDPALIERAREKAEKIIEKMTYTHLTLLWPQIKEKMAGMNNLDETISLIQQMPLQLESGETRNDSDTALSMAFLMLTDKHGEPDS